MLMLHIGRRALVAVGDLAEAQACHNRLRDESNEGSSTWPSCYVSHHDLVGRVVRRTNISYNGRMWSGKKADMGDIKFEVMP